MKTLYRNYQNMKKLLMKHRLCNCNHLSVLQPSLQKGCQWDFYVGVGCLGLQKDKRRNEAHQSRLMRFASSAHRVRLKVMRECEACLAMARASKASFALQAYFKTQDDSCASLLIAPQHILRVAFMSVLLSMITGQYKQLHGQSIKPLRVDTRPTDPSGCRPPH